MRCRDARRSFTGRLDGRLPPDGRAALEAHLAACAACRAELAGWERAAEGLRALGPTPVPSGLAARAFRAAVEAPTSARAPFAWFVPVAERTALAGALAAAAVWAGVLARNAERPPAAAAQDPVELAVLLWTAEVPDGE